MTPAAASGRRSPDARRDDPALAGPGRRRWLDPEARFGLRLTLFALAVVLVAVPFGALLAQVAGEGRLVAVDADAARALHRWAGRSSGAVDVLRVVSHLGSPVVCHVLAALGAGFAWARRSRRLAVYLVCVAAGAALLSTIVKMLVARDRPALEDPIASAHGFSFPSGHATASTAVYGALFLVFVAWLPARRRRWALAATVVFVTGVGISRLVLGVHYVTDVVGGHVLGLAWLTAVTAAFSIWREERGRPAVNPLGGVEPEAPQEPRPPAPPARTSFPDRH